MRISRRAALVAGAAVAVLAGLAWSGGISGTSAVHPAQADNERHHGDNNGDHGDDNGRGPVALPGYEISLFAKGPGGHSHPDPIVYDHEHIFVAYQDSASPTDSVNTSTIVEYTDDGSVVKSFTAIVGRCDGMRVDPSTGLLWATFNEDGNSKLETIDPVTKVETPYTFVPAIPPHGGGYDDLAFLPAQPPNTAFIAASNPQSSPNTAPAVVLATLNSPAAGQAKLTQVLAGNATATDIATGSSTTLNLQDPDSLAIDASGDVDAGVDLVLVDQADSQLIFIHDAIGSPTAKVLNVGDQLGDTTWAGSESGRMFIVDGAANAIYTMRGEFSPKTIYTEAPSGSPVQGFIGTVANPSGVITPIAIGFNSPTGLLFVPDRR
jgi:hypothetical protein